MLFDIAFMVLLGLLAIPTVSGYYAYTRGRSFWLWFLVGTLLPGISCFILVLLPDESNPLEPELEALRVKHRMLGTKPELPMNDPLRPAVERAPIRRIDFEAVEALPQRLVRVLIDGKPLEQWLLASEAGFAAQDGEPERAGAYSPIPLALALPPYSHFMGTPSRRFAFRGMPVLLAAGPQIPASEQPEWRWAVRMAFYRRLVVWHSPCQTAREQWPYHDPEVWVFDRFQYEEALALLH
jgi:hypothetical protein